MGSEVLGFLQQLNREDELIREQMGSTNRFSTVGGPTPSLGSMGQTMFSFVDPKKIKDFGNNSNMVVTDEFNKSFMATRPAEKMVGGI